MQINPRRESDGDFCCLNFSYRLLHKTVGIIKAQSLSVFCCNSLRFGFSYFFISTSTSNKRFQGKEMLKLVPLVME